MRGLRTSISIYRRAKIAILTVTIAVAVACSVASQSRALTDSDEFALLKDFVTRFTHNADEIWTSVAMDVDCPISLWRVRDSVDGVLIRSRIRPLSLEPREYLQRFAETAVYLNVDVGCLDRDVGNPIFDIDVHFGIIYVGLNTRHHPFDLPFLSALINENFGAFGIGDEEYILEAVEESVEDAVTVFVSAHMGS